jgi:hypothetical protein
MTRSEEKDFDPLQSRLLRDRIIVLGTAIDDETAKQRFIWPASIAGFPWPCSMEM